MALPMPLVHPVAFILQQCPLQHNLFLSSRVPPPERKGMARGLLSEVGGTMTNTDQNAYIRLEAVPRVCHLPGRRPGRSLSVQSIYRWATKGLRGGSLRLRSVLVGGHRCTTREWWEDFLNGLNADGAHADATVLPRTPGRRARAAADARQKLEEVWGRAKRET